MAFGKSIKRAFSKKRFGSNMKSLGSAIGKRELSVAKKIFTSPKQNARMFHIANRDFIQPIGKPLSTALAYTPIGPALKTVVAAADATDKIVGASRTLGAAAVKRAQKKRGGRKGVQFAGEPEPVAEPRPYALA